MAEEIHDIHQKALAANLDPAVYGTIAEIGGGQETARWFFQVGGAAGTIAKTMSAYDMKFSDAIYGQSSRYVSRDRLHAMLEHEYSLLLERLDSARGSETTFFAFANTVAACSYQSKHDGHGWLGICFQHEPGAEPSRIDMHINLHGKSHMQDQKTLGVIGVNLIYGALFLKNDPTALLVSLMDQLYTEMVEVDMVEFSGPVFDEVDNRLVALQLVQHDMSKAALFTADGRVALASDALWRKAVLVERSRFHPPTNLTMDLLDCAQKAMLADTGIEADSLTVLSEMTLHNLSDSDTGEIDVQDFLNRADILCALGKNVLISNYGEFYQLAQYLFNYTKMPIAIVMGLMSLRQIFNEKYYEDLPGGILESFGRLFKNDLRLYVCAEKNRGTNGLEDIHSMQVAPHLSHLYAHLLENNFVKALDTVNEEYLSIFSHEVLDKIRSDNKEWEQMVPEQVSEIIKTKRLFHWKGQ